MVIEASALVDSYRPVRRVVFTHDFLRPQQAREYPTSTPRNLAWLVQLLGGVGRWKERAAELSIVNAPPITDRAFGKLVDNKAALKDYLADPEAAWARRYDEASIDAFAPLLARIVASDLVIGFELSPSIKRYLHAHGVPYVSIYIHPVRFLTDLCLAATTNSSQIAESLGRHKIEQGVITQDVRRYAARFAKHHSAAYSIPPSAAILIGQTERDAALISDGRFTGWQDYQESLESALQPYDVIVFVRHPYQRDSNGIPEYLRSLHRKTVVSTNASGYGVLFTNTSAPLVITLSSSLGVEAQSIEIPTQFLLSDPRQKFQVAGVDLPGSDAYGHGILIDTFWDELCSRNEGHKHQTQADAMPHFSLGADYLRDTLESWSFSALRQEASQVRCQTMLLPSSLLSRPQRHDIVSSMLGPAAATEPLDRMIRDAAEVGIELFALDTPVSVNESRDIAMSGPAIDNYLAKGFHPSESWGAWCSSAKSEIWIPVDADAVAERSILTVRMGLKVFEGVMLRSPVLRIRSGSRVLGYAFFRTSSSDQQIIEFSLTATSMLCVIELEISDMGSPADLGSFTDHRQLGFALTRLNWSCGAATPMQTSAEDTAPQLWGVNVPRTGLTLSNTP